MKVTEKMAARCKDVRGNRPAVIVCLGDSVTHGCFELKRYADGHWQSTCRPDEGYGARLERRLRNLFPVAAPSVFNVGIGGDNAGGGLARLERDVLSLNPDLVIVDFGLNDACHGHVEEGLATYKANMAGIFDKVLATGAECMLLTPNFMCSYVSDGVIEEYKGVAAHCAQVQTSGTFDRYVEAARAGDGTRYAGGRCLCQMAGDGSLRRRYDRASGQWHQSSGDGNARSFCRCDRRKTV